MIIMVWQEVMDYVPGKTVENKDNPVFATISVDVIYTK
jgi:hypothetical protein